MEDQSLTLFTPDEVEEETEEDATDGIAADEQEDTGSEIEETETAEGLRAQKRWSSSEYEFQRDNIEEVPASSSSGSTAIAVILFIIGLLLMLYGWVL